MGCNDTSVRCGKDPRYAPSKSLRFLTQVVQAGFHIESNNGQVTTHRHGIRKMLIAKSSMSCSCFSQATIGNYAHKVFPYGIPARRARTNRVHHGRHAPLGSREWSSLGWRAGAKAVLLDCDRFCISWASDYRLTLSIYLYLHHGWHFSNFMKTAWPQSLILTGPEICMFWLCHFAVSFSVLTGHHLMLACHRVYQKRGELKSHDAGNVKREVLLSYPFTRHVTRNFSQIQFRLNKISKRTNSDVYY